MGFASRGVKETGSRGWSRVRLQLWQEGDRGRLGWEYGVWQYFNLDWQM